MVTYINKNHAPIIWYFKFKNMISGELLLGGDCLPAFGILLSFFKREQTVLNKRPPLSIGWD